MVFKGEEYGLVLGLFSRIKSTQWLVNSLTLVATQVVFGTEKLLLIIMLWREPGLDMSSCEHPWLQFPDVSCLFRACIHIASTWVV